MKITLKKQDDGSYSLKIGEQEIAGIVKSAVLKTTYKGSTLTLKLLVNPLTNDNSVFCFEAL